MTYKLILGTFICCLPASNEVNRSRINDVGERCDQRGLEREQDLKSVVKTVYKSWKPESKPNHFKQFDLALQFFQHKEVFKAVYLSFS